MDKKLEEISKDIGDIKIILAVNTQSLQQHMRRSDALEEIVLVLNKKATMVEGILKFLGIVGVLLGIAMAVRGLFL